MKMNSCAWGFGVLIIYFYYLRVVYYACLDISSYSRQPFTLRLQQEQRDNNTAPLLSKTLRTNSLAYWVHVQVAMKMNSCAWGFGVLIIYFYYLRVVYYRCLQIYLAELTIFYVPIEVEMEREVNCTLVIKICRDKQS